MTFNVGDTVTLNDDNRSLGYGIVDKLCATGALVTFEGFPESVWYNYKNLHKYADWENAAWNALMQQSDQLNDFFQQDEDPPTDAVNNPDHYNEKKPIKWCGKCKQNLPKKSFAKNSAKKDGLQERCKGCRSKHYKDTGYAERAYENRIKRDYNLSLSELKLLEEVQQGGCAICKDENTKLFVDHNHQTGEVRGLLCHFCNSGLGLFRDNTQNLKAAIKYLKGK